MGQDQSKASQNGGVEALTLTQQEITSSAEFLKDYVFKEKIDSDTQLLQHKTSDQLLAMREFNVTDEAEFKKIYDRFKPKTLLNNQNIVRLFYCLKEKESQLCSTFFKVLAILEYVPNNLEKEVNNRIELKQAFSEDELWNILTQCIVGVNYLYEHSIPHDNIRPSTIYITSKGIVKVADPALLSQIPLYADTISQLNNIPSGTYLPPELLSAMFAQDYHPVYDQQKSDVFSLGMTVIHAALLQPLDDVYDYKNFTIDEGIVVQRLNKIRERYGQNLYKFLAAMVIMEPAERHDVQFFQSFLNQNSQSFAETPQHYAATQKMMLEKELDLNRIPANPQSQNSRRSSQYSQSQQQSQQYQPQTYQVQAKSMKKEQDDTGNILKFIPQDKETKMPIPDENPNTNEQGEGFLSTESDHQQGPELPANLIGNIGQRSEYSNNNIPFDINNNSTAKAAELLHNANLSNAYVPQQQSQQLSALNNYQQLSQIVKPSYTYSMNPTDPVINSTPVIGNTSNSIIPASQFPNSNSTTNPMTNNYAFNYQSNTSNQINQSLNSNRININNTNIPSNIPINSLSSVQTTTLVKGQASNYTPLSVQDGGITQSAPPLPGSSSLSQQQQQIISGSVNSLSNNTGSTAYQLKPNSAFGSSPISITPEYKHSADIEAILAKYRQPQQQQQQQISGLAGDQFSNTNGIVTISQNQPMSQLSQASPSFPPVNNGSTDLQYNRAYSPTFPSQPTSQQQDNGLLSQANTYNNSITNQVGQYSSLEAFKLQQNIPNNNGYQFAGNYDLNKPSSGVITSQKKEFVVESYQNNSKYEGEKLNGMRHGYGKFFYQDGGLFEGEWNQNKMHGKGVLSYASGKPAYDGDWLDDKFEGFGALYNETPAELNQPYDYSDFDNVDEYWTKYEGQFKDDNKEGQGTLYLSNGEKFVGGFDKDFVSGQGVFYPKNGQPFHGIWHLNKLMS